jgi:hypothetical protein
MSTTLSALECPICATRLRLARWEHKTYRFCANVRCDYYDVTQLTSMPAPSVVSKIRGNNPLVLMHKFGNRRVVVVPLPPREPPDLAA